MDDSRSSRRGRLLVPLLGTFVAGLLVGFGVASSVGGGRGDVDAATGEPRAPREAAAPSDEDDELALLRAEVARLRASGVERRALVEEAAAAGSAVLPGLGGAGGIELAAVEGGPGQHALEELRRAIESGMLDEWASSNSSRLSSFVILALLEGGQPHAALDLALAPGSSASMLERVGYALRDRGDAAAAARAFLEHLRRRPDDDDLDDALAEVAPDDALAILGERLTGRVDVLDGQMRMRMARLLRTAGRTDEALAILDEVIASGAGYEDAIDLVRELDPGGAEERLRALAHDDPSGDARLALFEMLNESERTDEARALVLALAEELPDSWRVRSALSELDPETALGWYRTRVDERPGDPGLWSEMGEALYEAERLDEAIEAWERGFALDPGEGHGASELVEHAPARAFQIYEQALQGSSDDEMWGDYGDALWRAGRKDDAEAAWRKAMRIDPDDGEWLDNLRDIARGRSPI